MVDPVEYRECTLFAPLLITDYSSSLNSMVPPLPAESIIFPYDCIV